MRESFVGSTQDLVLANENLKSKIEYLQRQRIKRDHYLNDLRQNLNINKQTLRELSQEKGGIDQVVQQLMLSNGELERRLQLYYEDYQNLNAQMLMEHQLRLEDRQYFNQRMIEFDNKISDFRKYLHDKEDTYNAVSLRLKKHEEIQEPLIEEKLYAYKQEIEHRTTNQFIAELLREKEYYQNECQGMLKDYGLFVELKGRMFRVCPEAEGVWLEYEQQAGKKVMEVVRDQYRRMEEEKKRREDEKDKRKLRLDPNKELIRLLKKEKLNTELLDQALTKAIEQNQQLMQTNQMLRQGLSRWQNRCRLLQAEAHIFALRLGEYDAHYCRKEAHSRHYYEEGERAGLERVTRQKLRHYGRTVSNYYDSQKHMFREYAHHLKEDIEKWALFTAESENQRRKRVEQNLITRSCSTPELVVGFDLDEDDGERLIIEEI